MEPKDLPEDARKALEKSLAAGPAVHEPQVQSKVAHALRNLPAWQPQELVLSGSKIVLFIDIDGIFHAQGDSRYDEATSSVVGEGLFRWWPHLRDVVDEHPDVDVVVHSSWRQIYPTLEQLRQALPADLAEMRGVLH